MTNGTAAVAMRVALLATIAVGACRDDKVTLAVARDGGAGTGVVTGVAGAGGGAGDAGAVDQGTGTGDASDGGAAGGPERNDASPGVWIDRTPCVVPSIVPETRDLPMVAFDTDRQKLLIFGGWSLLGDQMSDSWELDVATATWTSRNDCGAMTPQTTGSATRSTIARGASWSCSRARRAWSGSGIRTPLSGRCARPRRAPPSRPVILQGAVYDDTRGKVLVFDHRSLSAWPYVVMSLWEWDGGAGAWLLRRDDSPDELFGQRFPGGGLRRGAGRSLDVRIR